MLFSLRKTLIIVHSVCKQERICVLFVQREVIFLVTHNTTKGSLMFLTEEGRYERTYKFTQQDLNNSKVFYKHDAKFKFLEEYDSFQFEAFTDHSTNRLKGEYKIIITLTAMRQGGIDKYITLTPVICPEGGNVTISPVNLNTSGILTFVRSGPGINLPNNVPLVRMKLRNTPLNGKLKLGGKVVKPGDSFSQFDVDNGRIIYYHDHSDTESDRVGIAVSLVIDLSSNKDILVYESQLNITVTPLNDRMPLLLTKNPSMVVVRGQSRPISRDMLEIQDPDTRPSQIRYTVLDNGLQGRLLHKDNNMQSVSHFSQQDINEEKIVYIHDGVSSQTQFYFSATDGRFQPRETGLSRHFRIHAIPLTLNLHNQSTIYVDQGTTTAYITKQNIGAASNGDLEKIEYKITAGPAAGKLLVGDMPAVSFFQVREAAKKVLF